jgi:two-component system alkaline phosphatase synthesis response regulator PhoP
LQLISYFESHNGLLIEFSDNPIRGELTDLYLLPIEFLDTALNESALEKSSWLPIIAFGTDAYLPHAFLMGCSDYIKTPFDPEELYFRVIRCTSHRFRIFKWGNITFFPFFADLDGKLIQLSKQEYTVMFVLARNIGKTVHRRTLAYALWGTHCIRTRTIDMHISSLRKKLFPLLKGIYTIHGEGYLLEPLKT